MFKLLQEMVEVNKLSENFDDISDNGKPEELSDIVKYFPNNAQKAVSALSHTHRLRFNGEEIYSEEFADHIESICNENAQDGVALKLDLSDTDLLRDAEQRLRKICLQLSKPIGVHDSALYEFFVLGDDDISSAEKHLISRHIPGEAGSETLLEKAAKKFNFISPEDYYLASFIQHSDYLLRLEVITHSCTFNNLRLCAYSPKNDSVYGEIEADFDEDQLLLDLEKGCEQTSEYFAQNIPHQYIYEVMQHLSIHFAIKIDSSMSCTTHQTHKHISADMFAEEDGASIRL